MIRLLQATVALLLATQLFTPSVAAQSERWMTLPPTSSLPPPAKFVGEVSAMWAKQPNWTQSDLAKVKVPTWIVDADHDEAIERTNTLLMAAAIPKAGLLLQPEVSHFSMLQAPEQFSDDILRFLARRWD